MAADLLAMLWNANVEPNGDTYDDAISACEKCKECSIRDMFRRRESHEWKTEYFSVSIIFLAQRKPLGLFLHCERWSSYEFLHSQFQITEMADLDVPNSWATLASVTHFGILTNWIYLWLFEPILRYLEIPPNRSRCAPASPSCHILEPILRSKIHEWLCSKTPCSILCHAEPSWIHYLKQLRGNLGLPRTTCLRAVIDFLWSTWNCFGLVVATVAHLKRILIPRHYRTFSKYSIFDHLERF